MTLSQFLKFKELCLKWPKILLVGLCIILFLFTSKQGIEHWFILVIYAEYEMGLWNHNSQRSFYPY